MITDTIASAPRQRMIENMAALKLGWHSPCNHNLRLKTPLDQSLYALFHLPNCSERLRLSETPKVTRPGRSDIGADMVSGRSGLVGPRRRVA